MLISLFCVFPIPRFHSFASGPSVLKTKFNTALKIMVPNILIAPLSDKVKGTALYHKPYSSNIKLLALSFLENNGRSPGAQYLPLRILQADTSNAPGGNDAGQEVKRPPAQPDQAGGDRVPGSHSWGAGCCSLHVCMSASYADTGKNLPSNFAPSSAVGAGRGRLDHCSLSCGPRPYTERDRVQEGSHLEIYTQNPHTKSKDKFLNFTPPFFYYYYSK